MKLVSALSAFVFSTGLVVAGSSFALGSGIVVAPSGPAAEPEGSSAAAQSDMSLKDKAHKQRARASSSQSAHRRAPDAASGSGGDTRESP
jgi:hypothetical protein